MLLRVYSRVKIFVIALTSRISAQDSIVMNERLESKLIGGPERSKKKKKIIKKREREEGKDKITKAAIG